MIECIHSMNLILFFDFKLYYKLMGPNNFTESIKIYNQSIVLEIIWLKWDEMNI